MDWQRFQNHNQANTSAFEAFCNQLFERYCKRIYSDALQEFVIVNGAGGDGGIESYAMLKDNSFICLQAKWFINAITDNQFAQIEASIKTALKLRPNIKEYIVCIPRDFGNIKIGRGKKPIKISEYSKWAELLENFKKAYPELSIILWGDNEILNQLQNPECYPLIRYWFEQSNFDYSVLIESFKREKGSWLKYKYFSDLHIEGQISEKLEDYIGANKLKILNRLKEIEENYLYIIRIFNEIKQWCQVSGELNEILEKISVVINNNINVVKNNEHIISKEISKFIIEDIKQIDFETLLEKFEECNGRSNSYYRKLEKIVKNFDYISFDYIQKNRQLLLSQNVLWLVGSPGTGKTHGLAGFVEKCLQENYNIPIFITAKNVTNNVSWKDILIKSLNLADIWSESDILLALESLCIFNEIANMESIEKKKYKAKIIICVDGLDEIKPYDFWINKMNEASVIAKNHTRIKFVFTSRYNVSNQIDYRNDLYNKMFYINEYGDTPTYKLFTSYINAYNIQIENPDLIKWVLRTPMALKLFCELFKNKKVNGVENKHYTISNLIKQKLDNIEHEFCYKYTKFSKSDNLIFNILVILSDYFIKNTILYEKDIVELLSKDEHFSLLEKSDIRLIVEFLENNGFLQSYVEWSNTLLGMQTKVYMKGIQPFFDYILSVRLIDEYDNPLDTEYCQTGIDAEDSLSIYAALLLEKKNILISDIPYFHENLDFDYLAQLNFFALANNSADVSTKYKERILQFMGHNSNCLIMTLNELILQVTRIPHHPLGGLLLHEFLCEFRTPMQRDLMWSIQKWLSNSEGKKWNCVIQNELEPKIYQLTKSDQFDGLPIIYAWALTNIDNIKREEYRKELMRWAIASPNEFIKLLELVYKTTNDPQMQEELLAVTMGLTYTKSANLEILQYLKNFLFKEIFNISKTLTINNIAIRQYARCIAEYLYSSGSITEDERSLCIPPFKNNINLELDLKATLEGSRMGGFAPITYDLSRYVLCDSIDYLFFGKNYENDENEKEENIEYYGYFNEVEIDAILNEYPNLSIDDKNKLKTLKKHLINQRKLFDDFQIDIQKIFFEENLDEINEHIDEVINSNQENNNPYERYNEAATKLLKKFAKYLNLEYIQVDQFVLGAAYAYLKQNGWNEDTENADRGIKEICFPADHGSKSRIMTLCEKYIWCFKHEIYGYLSDILTPRNDYNIEKLDDYSLLVSDLINPAQEMYNVDAENDELSQEWYLPKKLSPTIPNITNSKAGIIQWIKDAPIPNFSNWIEIKDYKPLLEYNKQWFCLYSFNCVYEPNLKTRTCLFQNSLIISKEMFSLLINDIKNNKNGLCQYLFNHNNTYSQTLVNCYITPKEICQMPWKIDCEDKLYFKTVFNNKIVDYNLIKCVEQCTANYANGHDVYYELPSKYIRSSLGISDGDGVSYTNKNDEVIAKYFKVGIPWGEQQNFLCIDKNMLLENLNKKNEMLIWIVKIIREPTHICYEKYKNFYVHKNSSWIIWFDEVKQEWQRYCFAEDLRIKN